MDGSKPKFCPLAWRHPVDPNRGKFRAIRLTPQSLIRRHNFHEEAWPLVRGGRLIAVGEPNHFEAGDHSNAATDWR